MKLKTLAVAVAAIAALAGAAQGKSAGTVETTPDSRVGNVTKDKTRDPGLFGAHWWANRFLSRHMEIEKFKGKSVDVVLLGDSIMHFWEWKQPESWKRFAANRTVLNLGYGGDRTQHVLWRIAHGELDGYDARHVVLMIGTNNNSFKDSKPENVSGAIELIVSKIREKQPKAKIILHPIFPRGNSAQSVRHVDARARNDRTNALLKQFADRDGKIIWIDFNDRLVDASGWVPKTIMRDEIHPTAAGYDIWMEALAPVIGK
jgi:lysophospholipase L1-like esterase